MKRIGDKRRPVGHQEPTDLRFDPAARPWLEPWLKACTDVLAKASDQAPTLPDAQLVKASTVRLVYRATFTDPAGLPRDVHLKIFRPAKLADRLADNLRGSRGGREFDRLAETAARGLPCVRPLAAMNIKTTDGRRSLLVTQTGAGAPLPRGPLPTAQAMAAGQLLRRAHDLGLHARDLHPGNVLADGTTLTLLDLTSARCAQPLEADERAFALAFFCQDLEGGVTSHTARPLLVAYGASTALVRHAARIGRRLRLQLMLSFGRRAGRACRHTLLERRRGERLALHQQAASLHDTARATFQTTDLGEMLKTGRRGSVRRQSGLIVKEREAAPARRLFQAAYLLQYCGVPCPQPVALCLSRGRGQVAFVDLQTADLHRTIHTLSSHQLLDCAARLGQMVGRLHGHGLRHRDLKLENLIRTDDGVVWLVDLDGLCRRAPIEMRGRGADIGRLLAAVRDGIKMGHIRNVDEPALRRMFWRSYTRAATCLLLNRVPRRLRRHIEVRARAWATAHERADGH